MSLLLMTLLNFGYLYSSALGTREFYNIAHMTNTPGSVDWALDRGANGVEVDLTFDTSTGTPLVFRHSAGWEPCDCTCICPVPFWSICKILFPDSVCAKLLDGMGGSFPCRAESAITDLLAAMAKKTNLALIVIDSKINGKDMDGVKMNIAGHAVVNAIITHLFDNGYGGKVIIGSPRLDTLPYLLASVESVNKTPYRSRVFFTIDYEIDNIVETLRQLHSLPTNNIVYGTGVSACIPVQIKSSTMKLAAINTAQGVVGLTYLWGIDKESTIKSNLAYVQGVMSNYPGRVYDILQENGVKLATQSSPIPAANRSEVITSISNYESRL